MGNFKTRWIRIEWNAEGQRLSCSLARLLIVIILSRPESSLSLGAAAVVRRAGYILPVTGLLSMRLKPTKAIIFAPARLLIALFLLSGAAVMSVPLSSSLAWSGALARSDVNVNAGGKDQVDRCHGKK